MIAHGAIDALEPAARQRGWATERIHDSGTFCRMVIRSADAGVLVDLAVNAPPDLPPSVTPAGPTLAPEELAGHKVLALPYFTLSPESVAPAENLIHTAHAVCRYSWSTPPRFLAAWTLQDAVGCAVAPRTRIRRLACLVTASTRNRVPDTVTASKKSQASRASARERRKPAHGRAVVRRRPFPDGDDLTPAEARELGRRALLDAARIAETETMWSDP